MIISAPGRFLKVGVALFCLTTSVGTAVAQSGSPIKGCPPGKGLWSHLEDAKGDTIPMRYRVAQVNNAQVLFAEGEIKRGETNRLAEAVSRAGRISEVVFDSPGGSSYEGMDMGRFIRKRGLATRITGGAACFSACSMAFLGGVIRRVDQGGAYGVHMATRFDESEAFDFAIKITENVMKVVDEKTSKAERRKIIQQNIRNELRALEQEKAQWARTRANYLIEMSVSLRLMIPNFDTAASEQYWLCRGELKSYSVVNVD